MNQEPHPTTTTDSHHNSGQLPANIDQAVVRAAEELGVNYTLLHNLVDQYKSSTQQASEPVSKIKLKRRCFVISPIGAEDSKIRDHANDVLKFIIEPAMSQFGIESVRSDHMADTGRITEQMFREIFQADICVAVLTGANPNVYYELAVAQCAARPMIILIEKGQDLPFDVKDLRSVYYSMNPVSDLVNGVYSDQVQAQIAHIEKSGWQTSSLFEQFPYGRLFQQEQQIQRLIEASQPEALDNGVYKTYSLPGCKDKELIILTGDIAKIGKAGIDAIVSPIDTYMELGRYHDGSISGNLRFLDADKTEGGRVEKDVMKARLERQVKSKDLLLPVLPGTVLETKAHQLKTSHEISQIFHLATTEGSPRRAYKMRNEIIDLCVSNVFTHFKQQAKTKTLDSLAFPMLGAATSKLEVMDVAQNLCKAIITEMKQDQCSCQKVFIIAWLESHRHALSTVTAALNLEERQRESQMHTQDQPDG